MSALGGAARAASSAGGQVLRAATRVIAARPATKPLHPRGSVVGGTLHRFGAEDKTGAVWLDEAGDDRVLVRQSRAVGLPAPVPDIFGLAIRVPTEDGHHGDLLLASTGLGRLTRFTLTLARSPYGRPMSTLLPYRAPTGAVLLSAVFLDELTATLAWAVGSGAGIPSPICCSTRRRSTRGMCTCRSIRCGTSSPAWRPTTGSGGSGSRRTRPPGGPAGPEPLPDVRRGRP